MIKILSAILEKPDGDGDISPEIKIEFKNESERPIEYLSSKVLILNKNGLLISSNNDENDDFIEPGEIWPGDLSTGYFNSSSINGEMPKGLLEILGCACNHHELGVFELEPQNLAGIGEKRELGDGISLVSLTVTVSKPDDDGDLNVEIKALLDNSSLVSLPRASLSGKILRSGREVEDLSNYSDPIPAGQMTVIEVSSYLKKRQLSGASVDIRLSLFPIIAREVKEVSFN